MWNERNMPERWYELLRERMHVEQLRMRIVKDARPVENDLVQQLLAEAQRLDAEMLFVMKQTVAEALVLEQNSTQTTSLHRAAPLGSA
jgi:hypothetical protein